MKYYLRGLGVGIIVTTIILTIANRNNRLTDENAVKRAKELGYVLAEKENTKNGSIDLEAMKSQLTPKPNEDMHEVIQPTEPVHTPTPVAFATATPSPEDVVSPYEVTPTHMPEITNAPAASATPTGYADSVAPYTDGDFRTYGPRICWPGKTPVVRTVTFNEIITINENIDSYKISELLSKEGILKDPYSFAKYCIYWGMDYYILNGTYKLSSDMTYDQLLSAITGEAWWREYSE